MISLRQILLEHAVSTLDRENQVHVLYEPGSTTACGYLCTDHVRVRVLDYALRSRERDSVSWNGFSNAIYGTSGCEFVANVHSIVECLEMRRFVLLYPHDYLNTYRSFKPGPEAILKALLARQAVLEIRERRSPNVTQEHSA